MKLKFIVFTFLLLFARGCDFYSTSLWYFQENGAADETNPLSSVLGMGWSGMAIVNLLLVLLIIGLYYFYCFHFKSEISKKWKPNNFWDYASIQYFNEPGKLYQLLYRFPKNKRIAFAHTGYVAIRGLIVASLLATIHNLGQFYQWPIYSSFRSVVKRPQFVIYGLIIVCLIYFFRILLKREFKQYQLLRTTS